MIAERAKLRRRTDDKGGQMWKRVRDSQLPMRNMSLSKFPRGDKGRMVVLSDSISADTLQHTYIHSTSI